MCGKTRTAGCIACQQNFVHKAIPPVLCGNLKNNIPLTVRKNTEEKYTLHMLDENAPSKYLDLTTPIVD